MTKIQVLSPLFTTAKLGNVTQKATKPISFGNSNLERTPSEDVFELNNVDSDNYFNTLETERQKLKREEDDRLQDDVLVYGVLLPELMSENESDKISNDMSDDVVSSNYEDNSELKGLDENENSYINPYYENDPDDLMPFDALDDFLEDIF